MVIVNLRGKQGGGGGPLKQTKRVVIGHARFTAPLWEASASFRLAYWLLVCLEVLACKLLLTNERKGEKWQVICLPFGNNFCKH